MIKFRDTLGSAIAGIKSLSNRIRNTFSPEGLRRNLSPLRKELEELIVLENTRAILEGLDKNDVPMVPTQREMGARSRSLGYGPPLAPRFRDSRVITMFRASVTEADDGGFEIDGDWGGLFFLQYHVDSGAPRTKLPVRDIVGIRPSTAAKIDAKVANWAANIRI